MDMSQEICDSIKKCKILNQSVLRNNPILTFLWLDLMNFSSARPTIPGRPGLHKPAANQGLAFGKALEEAEIHWLVACVIKRVACLGSRSRMASR